MAIATAPAINLARRLIAKHALKPPIDVEALVKVNAELIYAKIPVDGVDGISLNLKTKGKKTKVIVNTSNPPLRQRFTLAHELGHIVIPWHTGNIVDHLDPVEAYETRAHWGMEEEANAFAGELLVPSDWLKKTLLETRDLANAHKLITSHCEVSLHAAAIRLTQILPKNIVFAVVRAGTVEFSGKTEGTLANILSWESDFDGDVYNYNEEYFTANIGNRRIHWWKLPSTVNVVVTDDRTWREILNGIVADIGISGGAAVGLKSSANGVVAYANGVAKRSTDYSINSVIAACMQRFKDRAEFAALVDHPDFEAFLYQKARSLVEPER